MCGVYDERRIYIFTCSHPGIGEQNMFAAPGSPLRGDSVRKLNKQEFIVGESWVG
jgi:hypothetical protein